MAKVLVTVLAVLALAGCGERSRVEQVRDMVAWEGCADVVIGDRHVTWPHADEFATISCEHLGPVLRYARFADEQELRRDLLAEPPSRAVCLAGLEVTVDDLDPGQFEKLCRDLHGVRIDATRGIPEPAYLSVGDEPKLDAYVRACELAQKRALERHWHL